MRIMWSCVGVVAVLLCWWLVEADPSSDAAGTTSTLATVDRLTSELTSNALSDDERLATQQTLFEILAGTGAGAPTFGTIAGSITDIRADHLPLTGHIPGGPAANATAWERSDQGYLPTNDWFQGIAGFPEQRGHMNSTGPYLVSWTGDAQGVLLFRTPTGFSVNGTTQPYILQRTDDGFTVGASNLSGKPTVRWQETGNLARDISYQDGDLVIHAIQGAVFQGVSYRGIAPYLTVQPGRMTMTTLPNDIVKYEINGRSRRTFIYGNSRLRLALDSATGTVTSPEPYTGNVNIVSVPLDLPSEQTALLDAHADAVVVKAQGTLLPDDKVQFLFLSEDLNGHATANKPLIFLKSHQVDTLIGQKPTRFKMTTLTGAMTAYSGSMYLFNVPAPSTSPTPLDVLPALTHGQTALTQAQAIALVNDRSQSGLAQTLTKVSQLNSGPSAYNKRIYQQGLTLAYAQRLLDIAFPDGKIPKQHHESLQRVYDKMKANMRLIFGNLQYDTDYGTIVVRTDDYGNHSHYNDHIAQYSYVLNALTCMKLYSDQYDPTDAFFTEPIAGLPYTGQQLGDLLAADIGETGPGGQMPVHRNFDVYNSHSWLSGTQGYADGSNTESESEAVFGGLTVAAWLAVTQPNSPQAQVAKTRWAMEVQGLQTYFLIDPEKSVYRNVSQEFVTNKTNGKIPPVVSNLFENKVTSDTFWGGEWDRQVACEFMPAGANLMDSYLNNMSSSYQKLIADYILRNWDNFDMSNRIQSVLIAIVAKTYPDQVLGLIQQVQQRDKMDDGTNGFLLQVIGEYAKNQQAQ